MNLRTVKSLLSLSVLTMIMTFWSLSHSHAQTPNSVNKEFNITAFARYSQNAVFIRWNPNDFSTWNLGNTNGYKLKRYPTKRNGVSLDANEMKSLEMRWNITVTDEVTLRANGNNALDVAATAIYHPEQFIDNSSSDNPLKQSYEQSKAPQDRMDYSMIAANQNFDNAKFLGLGYFDNTVDPDMEYVYVVSIEGVDELKVSMGLAKVETNSNQQAVNSTVGVLTSESEDLMITIKWNTPTKGAFQGYYIYKRSQTTAGAFDKVSDLPFVYNEDSKEPFVIYRDKVTDNTTMYEYYVTGIDKFGIEGDPSPIIAAKGKPKPLDVVPFIEQIIESNKGKLSLKWRFPDDLIPKITGFQIRRSPTRDGQYQLIHPGNLAPDQKEYLDLLPGKVNYYIVVAQDINGYDLFSVPKLAQLEDSEPPSKVIGINGKVSEDGSAYIKWTPNTEDDLLGYQVLVSNRKDDGYVVITDSWLTESELYYYFNVETLSEEVWVQISAIDYHHNHSILSDPYRLRLPDIIPPSPPALVKVEREANGILIEWRKSHSKDVEKHIIERKPVYGEENEWIIIKEFPTLPNIESDTVYLDTLMGCRIEYDYRVVAQDEVPLSSFSSAGRASFSGYRCNYSVMNPYAFYTLTRLKPNTSLAVKTDKGIIVVCWSFPCSMPIYQFRIYRRIVKDGPLILIKSISPEDAINNSSFQVIDSKTGKPVNIGSSQPYGIGGTSTSRPNTGTSGEPKPTVTPFNPNFPIKSPKNQSAMCFYMMEDDDFNTLLNLNDTDDLEYVIQVEYTDGSVSEMTKPIKP